MTDNEIKKALECCSEHEGCYNCPCYSECGDLSVVTTEVLNLINRQQAEIDGLKTRNINNCRHWQKKYSSLRAEAIKEFARKLKCGVPQETGVIRCKDVDNLVKEMVGKENVK